MEEYDTVIAGAGPAGLFCAIHAAAPKTRVLLLEKNPAPGVKLNISGTGQCNITHDGDIRSFFSRYGAHGQFLKPALQSFTNRDLIRFFEGLGLTFETMQGGKIFPKSRNAGDITSLLVRECDLRGVTLRCGEPVRHVEYADPGFRVITPAQSVFARHLVLATGGASYPKTGSTGDGYRIAASLGHTIADIGPALVPLIMDPFPFASLAGMSFPALPFSVWRNGRRIAEGNGDVLFTHTGLSGPGILDRSRDIRAGDEIRLAFTGPVRRDAMERGILAAIARSPSKTIRSIVAGLGIPERLSRLLPERAGIPPDATGAHLPASSRSRLVEMLTEYPLVVSAPGDLSVAMVTRGGIALDEVNPKTLESRLVPGLFFAGEVLDIDGDTGGFNIQAAFSTGYCAAQGTRSPARTSPKQPRGL